MPTAPSAGASHHCLPVTTPIDEYITMHCRPRGVYYVTAKLASSSDAGSDVHNNSEKYYEYANKTNAAKKVGSIMKITKNRN